MCMVPLLFAPFNYLVSRSINDAFTLPNAERGTKSEIHTDTDKLTQNPPLVSRPINVHYICQYFGRLRLFSAKVRDLVNGVLVKCTCILITVRKKKPDYLFFLYMM